VIGWFCLIEMVLRAGQALAPPLLSLRIQQRSA
jgi:hypothetical protein